MRQVQCAVCLAEFTDEEVKGALACPSCGTKCVGSEDVVMTDDSIMPFGKHKGEKLANVPASYLLWLNAQWDDNPPGENESTSPEFVKVQQELKAYIEDNIEVLKMERNKERRSQ